jgi:predicted nuclease with TOPRIM domain
MSRTLNTCWLVLVPLVAGCGGLGKRVESLESRDRDLEQQVEKLRATVASLEKLPQEVGSAKAYASQVTEKVKAMRAETVRMLEEQRVLAESGREEYLRILRREQELLKGLEGEMQVAIDELQKKSPSPERVIGREPAAGFSSPDRPAASPDAQEPDAPEKEKDAEPAPGK